jgi:dihydroorotate dehydrogenase (NAD+) catalytic subunit
MGGVTYGNDAVEMWMAGAQIIGVGTAIYYRGIEAFDLINKEIIAYLDEMGYETINDIPRLEGLGN